MTPSDVNVLKRPARIASHQFINKYIRIKRKLIVYLFIGIYVYIYHFIYLFIFVFCPLQCTELDKN